MTLSVWQLVHLCPCQFANLWTSQLFSLSAFQLFSLRILGEPCYEKNGKKRWQSHPVIFSYNIVILSASHLSFSAFQLAHLGACELVWGCALLQMLFLIQLQLCKYTESALKTEEFYLAKLSIVKMIKKLSVKMRTRHSAKFNYVTSNRSARMHLYSTLFLSSHSVHAMTLPVQRSESLFFGDTHFSPQTWFLRGCIYEYWFNHNHTCNLSFFVHQQNFQNFKLYAKKCVNLRQ